MNLDDFTEADEAATDRETALRNLCEQVLKKETMGVIAMYERAALDAGVPSAQVEAVLSSTPFGKERAEEIWAERRAQHYIEHAMTAREIAYVKTLWLTMPGETCWMDAFFRIKNGKVDTQGAIVVGARVLCRGQTYFAFMGVVEKIVSDGVYGVRLVNGDYREFPTKDILV